MANVAVYNMEGNEVGSIELNDSIFGVKINEHLVHMAVLQQLANKRDRKEPVMQDRAPSGLRSGRAAELYLPRHQGITHLSLTKKKRGRH